MSLTGEILGALNVVSGIACPQSGSFACSGGDEVEETARFLNTLFSHLEFCFMLLTARAVRLHAGMKVGRC